MTSTAATHFNKAAHLHAVGKVDEAVAELKLTIQLDPTYTKSYLVLAAIYESQTQNQRAVDLYRKVLEFDIDEPQANLRLGLLLVNMGCNKDALTPLRMAWSNDNKNARAANALAQALDATGDYPTARIMYETALKLNPDLSNAYYNLGTLCFNEEKFESAITYFMTYMVKAGDSSRAHRNIGKALVRMGQLDGALKSFEKAARLDPNDPTIYYNVALAYLSMDNTRTALENFRHTLKLYPNYLEARYAYAKALLFASQIPQAMLEFQTVIQQCPDHYRALNGLATCHINAKDFETSAVLLREAVELEPEFAFGHYNLAIALHGLGYEYESKHHFQEAARLDQTGQLASRANNPTPSARIASSTHLVANHMSRKLSMNLNGALPEPT